MRTYLVYNDEFVPCEDSRPEADFGEIVDEQGDVIWYSVRLRVFVDGQQISSYLTRDYRHVEQD